MDIRELEEGKQLMPQFEKRGGLLPVAVQEQSTGQILMLASVNKEALEITLNTKRATFWSTSRRELWTKGLTSGDVLLIKDVLIDCDQDALIYQVELEGNGSCHTFANNGEVRKACFYRKLNFVNNELEFIKGME